jgi:Kef-type K+ transport system membrane component KefB
MTTMSSHETTIFLIVLGGMLILARILSRWGERFNLPTLTAEVLAGIILGPTILGYAFPELYQTLFPQTGSLPEAYDTIFSISVIMLLFLAGMHLDFSLFTKGKKSIVTTSLFGISIPFIIGGYFAWKYPDFFYATEFSIAPYEFQLTFATIIAISSLPVIARILMQQNMMNTTMGLTVLGTAVVSDLVGWFALASILVYTNPVVQNINILYTIFYIIIFFAATYFISGKKVWMNKLLAIKEKHSNEPAYDIAFILGLCLLSAAFTNAINIHPSLGAFIAGIVCKRIIGGEGAVYKQLELFIINFFAPIFFISIGLKLNFIENFNFWMIVATFMIATAGKLIGGTLGAHLGGYSWKPAVAIGFILNVRGSMEIIMGAVALKAGLIGPQLFVTFVIVAIATSLVAQYIVEMKFVKESLNSAFKS